MRAMKIADEHDVQMSKSISTTGTKRIPRRRDGRTENIVYADRDENFPRDSRRKVRASPVAAGASDICDTATRNARNLCRGI